MSKYKWMIAGAAFIGIGCYYLSDDGKKSNTLAPRPLPAREKVLAIVRELKKELVPIFITLASFSISIKEKLGGRIPNEQIKEILMANSPIPLQIQNAEIKIYKKHQIEQSEFQNICEKYYGNDKEIQYLIEDIKSTMNASFQGIHPNVTSELPEFITAEFILKVTEDLYDATKYTTFKNLQELKLQGIQLDVNSPEFRLIAEELERDTLAAKNKIYENYKMNGFEDSPNMIMHVAIQKFKIDKNFITQLAKIEQDFQLAMTSITTGNFSDYEISRLQLKFEKEMIFQELAVPREVIEEETIEEIYA